MSSVIKTLNEFSPDNIPSVRFAKPSWESSKDIYFKSADFDKVQNFFKEVAGENAFEIHMVPKIFFDNVVSKIQTLSDVAAKAASTAAKEIGELKGKLNGSETQVKELSLKLIELGDVEKNLRMGAEKIAQVITQTCIGIGAGLSLMGLGYYGTTREESKQAGWQKDLSYGAMIAGFLITASSAARLYLTVQKF